MAAENRNELAQHQALVDLEVNRIVRRGSFFASMFGYISAIILLVMHLTELMPNMLVPVLWSAYAGTFSIIVYWLARKDMIKGLAGAVILLLYGTVPSMIFVLSHFILPSGSATYINGPPVLVYVFLIILAGFTFNSRLSLLAGVSAGIQYFALFMLDREHLLELRGPELVVQDLVEPPIYLFKAAMMAFIGFLIGILANFARGLMTRILAEEKERSAMSRLFGQFVSEEVKERILKAGSEFTGDKKDVVILFADIRGFTSFSEKFSPEEIVIRLNEYFDAMVKCITEHGGVVDKFIGDAVMAVFGGVLDLDNPCDAAQNAALDMRRSLEELNRKWAAEDGVSLENGIGMHYGPVLQGTIGSTDRKDFTVIGDSVNTASRLEGMCRKLDARIIISSEFYEGLSDTARGACSPIGKVRVKGKEEVLSLYRVREAA